MRPTIGHRAFNKQTHKQIPRAQVAHSPHTPDIGLPIEMFASCETCFRNTLPVSDGESATCRVAESHSWGLAPAAQTEMTQLQQNLLAHIEQNLATVNSRDDSVYTGPAGIALAFLRGACCEHRIGKAGQHLKIVAELLLKFPATMPADVAPSLLCGSAGLYVLSALLHHHQGNDTKRDAAVQLFLSLSADATDVTKLKSDEWLYGRAGYLHGLLLLNQSIGAGKQGH